MDLQHQPRSPALGAQPFVDPDHRHLDHVCRCSLHDGVDGEPLAKRARLSVRGAELGDRPPAAEEGRHVAVGSRLRDRAADELLHAREAREVGVDVRLRLLARNLQVLGQPEGGDAVDDPEVDHLGDVALVFGQGSGLLAEHLRGRAAVDVFPGRERLLEHGLA